MVEIYDEILRNSLKVNPTAGIFPKKLGTSLIFLSYLPTIGQFYLIPREDIPYLTAKC